MLVAVLLIAITVLPWTAPAMRSDHLATLRQETVDMFYHGFSNYMLHAFPEDEVYAPDPVSSCVARHANRSQL